MNPEPSFRFAHKAPLAQGLAGGSAQGPRTRTLKGNTGLLDTRTPRMPAHRERPQRTGWHFQYNTVLLKCILGIRSSNAHPPNVPSRSCLVTSSGLLLVNLGFWILRFPDFRVSRSFFLQNTFWKYVGRISRNK
jgi:hypothetical protein